MEHKPKFSDFNSFNERCWQDHGDDAVAVAADFELGVGLIASPKDLEAFCALVVHVLGEHLGRWDAALAMLRQTHALPCYQERGDSSRAVKRSEAIIAICKKDRAVAEQLAAEAHGGPAPAASTKARILATAAAALVTQGQLEEAEQLFLEAENLLGYGPGPTDPAARAMAVTANNLAADLEERSSLSPRERDIIRLAARLARKYWEMAGGWVEIERAEYRLARSHLAAGDAATALTHADACLAICVEQRAGLFEHFFAHEARARCLHGLDRASDAQAARDAANRALGSVRSSVAYMTEQIAVLDLALAKA